MTTHSCRTTPKSPLVPCSCAGQQFQRDIERLNKLLDLMEQSCRQFTASLQLLNFCRYNLSETIPLQSRFQMERAISMMKQDGIDVEAEPEKRQIYLEKVREEEREKDHKIGYLQEWITLAGRNGGLSARDFRESLGPIQGALRKVTDWRDLFDGKSIANVINAFDIEFPEIVKVRHAMAHPEGFAEEGRRNYKRSPIKTPSLLVVEGSQGKVTIQNFLDGDMFYVTYNRQLIGYSLSEEKAGALIGMAEIFFGEISKIVRHNYSIKGES